MTVSRKCSWAAGLGSEGILWVCARFLCRVTCRTAPSGVTAGPQLSVLDPGDAEQSRDRDPWDLSIFLFPGQDMATGVAPFERSCTWAGLSPCPRLTELCQMFQLCAEPLHCCFTQLWSWLLLPLCWFGYGETIFEIESWQLQRLGRVFWKNSRENTKYGTGGSPGAC